MGDGARVVGVAGGGDVGRQSIGERERLEGGGERVARAIFEFRPQAKRPEFVEAAVEDADCGVVVTRLGIERF